MRYGTGRSAPSPTSLFALMKHRRRQLLALAARAERSRELAELDEAIDRGVEAIEAMTDEERVSLQRALQSQG